MNSTSENTRLNALAFLYDHLTDFPVWMRMLTRAQLENVARIMAAWPGVFDGSSEIMPMEETERREVIRAIRLCGGNVRRAAEALKMGRTTVYTRYREWRRSVEDNVLTHQASVLAHTPQKRSEEASFAHDTQSTI